MNRQQTGFIMAMVSAISWGTYGVFYVILVEKGLPQTAIITLAALINTVYFLVVGLATKSHNFKNLTWKHYILLTFSGLLTNVMGFSYGQAYANQMPVGVVSVVAFCNVIILVLFSVFFFRFKPNKALITSIILAILGVTLVLDVIGTGTSGITLVGTLWALSIPLILATIYTMNKILLLDAVDGNTIMFLRNGTAALIMLALPSGEGSIWGHLTQGIVTQGVELGLSLLGFALLPTVLCYATWQEAYKRIEPPYVQILYSLDPLTSFFLGFLFFRQSVLFAQILGILLILLAVANIVIREGKDTRHAQG